MCQLAIIILCVIGLCGGISIKGLAIGCLISVGIQIFCDILKIVLEKLV